MEKKKPVKKKIEDTLACSAFAEEGVPCPVGSTKKPGKVKTVAKKSASKKSVQDTLACSAFAEEGVPCPIGSAKKGGKKKK